MVAAEWLSTQHKFFKLRHNMIITDRCQQTTGWLHYAKRIYLNINVSFKNILMYLLIWLCQVLGAACQLFSCSTWDLVPWLGIKPRPPALGAWSLSHWTTREVHTMLNVNHPIYLLYKVKLCLPSIIPFKPRLNPTMLVLLPLLWASRHPGSSKEHCGINYDRHNSICT